MNDRPNKALSTWMNAFQVTDEARGVRFVNTLALVTTTPVGRRVADPDVGLLLDPVTLGDRLMAVSIINCIALIPLYREHAAAKRARALHTDELWWKAFESIELDIPPLPEP